LGKIVCFLSIFSQNNGHRQLLLQTDIILEIIIQNWWSRYQIEACEVFYLFCNKTDFWHIIPVLWHRSHFIWHSYIKP
jgi:hypothetical protein